MLRSFFITVSLTVILFTSGFASTPMVSVPQDTLNIGFVLYTKGNTPGTLNARWTYANVFTGSG